MKTDQGTITKQDVARASRRSFNRRFVHELNNGRYVVANWSDSTNQWQAPMTKPARILEDLECQSYQYKAAAIARARSEYTWILGLDTD